MRLPNWMARFTRPAARGRPSRRRAARSTRLSPSPAQVARHGLGIMYWYFHRAAQETTALKLMSNSKATEPLHDGATRRSVRGSPHLADLIRPYTSRWRLGGHTRRQAEIRDQLERHAQHRRHEALVQKRVPRLPAPVRDQPVVRSSACCPRQVQCRGRKTGKRLGNRTVPDHPPPSLCGKSLA